jgi:hypothetical protein
MATRPLTNVPSASQDISRPYFTQKVKLNSLHAHQVFDRGFELCANAIFSLSIVLRVFASDAQAREVEAIVDSRLNKVFDDIRTEVIRLEKLAESNGIEFSGVTYSNPKELEARITSPRAVRYIGLIREFDGLVAKFDILWLSGSIPDSIYSISLYEWKRRLLRVSGGMRSLAGRAITAAKRMEPMPVENASNLPAPSIVQPNPNATVSIPVV